MQKGFIVQLLALIILGLVLIGLIYFKVFSHQAPAETVKVSPLPTPSISTTKSYKSPLGFQFDYPATMSAREDSEEEFNKRGGTDFRSNFNLTVGYEPAEVKEAVVTLDKSENFDNSPLVVWVFNNPDQLTVDQWYKNYWYFPFIWGDFSLKDKAQTAPDLDIKIGTESAKLGKVAYSPGEPQFIYLPHQDQMYLIRLIGPEGDTIFKTLRFYSK